MYKITSASDGADLGMTEAPVVGTNIDAISGATITSDAYEGCVRDCFAAFDAVKGG